jgi:periplasmic divalent cation tolerance protein
MSIPQAPASEPLVEPGLEEPVVLLLTTFPDRQQAEAAARAWVEAGLAACIHIAPAGLSVYRWQGVIETQAEVAVTVKTILGRLEALAEVLQRDHPYELPEVLLVSPAGGSGVYMDWVRATCGAISRGEVP